MNCCELLARFTFEMPSGWLSVARHGYCERTGGEGDGTCSHGRKGTLSIPSSAYADWHSAAKACLAACHACKRCRHVSLSLRFSDCSWYHECPSTHVDLPSFRSAPVEYCEHCAKRQRRPTLATSKQGCDNPFLPNNTRAFAYPADMETEWSRRSHALRAESRCLRLGDHGVRWNCLGLELPDSTNASAATELLQPYLEDLEDTASNDQPDYTARIVGRDWALSRADRDAAVLAVPRQLPALQLAAVAELSSRGVARLSREWNFSHVVRSSGLLEAARAELDRRSANAGDAGAPPPLVQVSQSMAGLDATMRVASAALGPVARAYLGGAAVLSGVMLLRLEANLSQQRYVSGMWHHDRCGRRLKAFVFLQRVGARTQTTHVALGSHTTAYYAYHTFRSSRFADGYVQRSYRTKPMYGALGEGFVFDTNAIHRGGVDGTGERRDALVLEFNDAAKYADLAEARAWGVPCPSTLEGGRPLHMEAGWQI